MRFFGFVLATICRGDCQHDFIGDDFRQSLGDKRWGLSVLGLQIHGEPWARGPGGGYLGTCMS
jgi:hypothetical protein